MPVKKIKPFNFHSWLINALRRTSRHYPPLYQTANEGKEVYYIKSKSGKPMKRVRWTCNKCKKKFSNKEKVIDHINPVVATSGFVDWNVFISRMFCDKEGFQILCKNCHKIKSNLENLERKKNKLDKKKD